MKSRAPREKDMPYAVMQALFIWDKISTVKCRGNTGRMLIGRIYLLPSRVCFEACVIRGSTGTCTMIILYCITALLCQCAVFLLDFLRLLSSNLHRHHNLVDGYGQDIYKHNQT